MTSFLFKTKSFVIISGFKKLIYLKELGGQVLAEQWNSSSSELSPQSLSPSHSQ